MWIAGRLHRTVATTVLCKRDDPPENGEDPILGSEVRHCGLLMGPGIDP